jgi:hypothetical protein
MTPTNEITQIKELAKTNAVVDRCLRMYYYDQCTWNEAMMVAVINLTEDVASLRSALIECESSRNHYYDFHTQDRR